MAKKEQQLTSSEFSAKAGIPISSVNKLIREGKIKAKKKSGKWMINSSQLKLKAVQKLSKSSKPKPAKKTAAQAIKTPQPKKAATPRSKKTYSVAEFSEMTYLTEFGVMQWLKQGLLDGQQDDKGEWHIDASNLEVPNVKRLVR
jgi:hypothetical protein